MPRKKHAPRGAKTQKALKAQSRVEAIDSALFPLLKELRAHGVESFAINADGSWSTTFVTPKGEGASVIGFQGQSRDEESDSFSATAPLSGTPSIAALAAAHDRREVLKAATVTGVAPEILAEVEQAALKFEIESGVGDPEVSRLQSRIEAAKTDEERAHYRSLLAEHKYNRIAYAHS